MRAKTNSHNQASEAETDGKQDKKSKAILKYAALILLAAIVIIAVVTAACLIYGRITESSFTFSRFFLWNYAAGAVVFLIGMVSLGSARQGQDMVKGQAASFWVPMKLRTVDANTRPKRSPWLMFAGVACLAITGLIELLTR